MQPLWKTVGSFFKNENRTTIPSSNSISGYLPENKNTNLKILIQKDKCTPMFTAALFTIAKIRTQPKCPSIDEWIVKMWDIYTGILLSHKKEWNLAICNNMDRPRGYYVKWNMSDSER